MSKSKRFLAGVGMILALGLALLCLWVLVDNFLDNGTMSEEGKGLFATIALTGFVMSGIFGWQAFIYNPKPPRIHRLDPPRPQPPNPPGSSSIEYRPRAEGPGKIIDFQPKNDEPRGDSDYNKLA